MNVPPDGQGYLEKDLSRFCNTRFLVGRNKRSLEINAGRYTSFLIKVNGQVFTTPLNTPSMCNCAR